MALFNVSTLPTFAPKNPRPAATSPNFGMLEARSRLRGIRGSQCPSEGLVIAIVPVVLKINRAKLETLNRDTSKLENVSPFPRIQL